MTHKRRQVRTPDLGLGNFFRAHQAWYTQHADPEWGIAAFTGRHPQAALALAAQGSAVTRKVARIATVTDRIRATFHMSETQSPSTMTTHGNK